MFILRWLFLFSFFVFSRFPLIAEENSAESENLHHLFPGVVKVIVISTDEEPTVGTGFFISPDLLVTAGHVVSEGSVYFIDSEGQFTPATVLKLDKKYDLAILKAVDYKSEHFYSLGPLDNALPEFLTKFRYEENNVFHPLEIKKWDHVVTPGFYQGSFSHLWGICR